MNLKGTKTNGEVIKKGSNLYSLTLVRPRRILKHENTPLEIATQSCKFTAKFPGLLTGN